jgi:hypothetical protein
MHTETGVGIGSCLGRTWGQIIMGTKLIDATTMKDATRLQFIGKYWVRAILSAPSGGLFFPLELILMMFGDREGSSIVDSLCGTRVVVSIEDAPP